MKVIRNSVFCFNKKGVSTSVYTPPDMEKLRSQASKLNFLALLTKLVTLNFLGLRSHLAYNKILSMAGWLTKFLFCIRRISSTAVVCSTIY